MRKTFDAVYEAGLLRPLEPLQLAELQTVSLTFDLPSPAFDDDDVLDHELLRELELEDLRDIPLEEVQAALAKIPGSMSACIIAEREDRF